MDMIIRDVSDSDLDAVLSLNQSEVPHVGSVDLQKMRWYATHASYFRVAVSGGQLAAYLVGFRPGTAYMIPNYLWFCEHYDEFANTVRGVVELMTCEVNVRPPNESSMTFHRRLGFEQVGSLVSDDSSKEVAMLARHLPGQ